MLDHLGEPDDAAVVMAAIEATLARDGEGLTPDLGGSATTTILRTAIADALRPQGVGAAVSSRRRP